MSRKILVMTAVEAEKEAVLRGLRGNPDCEVKVAGVGPAAAAASTALALARSGAEYGLVVSAGIAGGFAGVAPVGSIVVASESVAADLGAETPEGFAGVNKLGFGTNRLEADASLASRLAEALRNAGIPAHCGPVLTLSTVTGTAATAEALALRVPGAAAEAMEGYGVAEAASRYGIPFLEIRAISNAVGPRDRAAWRIGDALAALEAASIHLTEVLSS
ncbi:futalosine hydrolase [Cohnella sp. CIP 111063]|uniref:futalosine hydrolase n=1 Tax=unclassified Cohnella TaxID=2636738 RepID=UPI000B8BC90D|nr:MULTISPECIES: futalosine hydrolase [unclassified Cohnella]OXS55254.1 futalosine hydrolase [Cohnella sp. CIP 111063]PRX65679.1 futalosine hydrolase [Cohnella sp. SGD-V74]